MIRIASAFFPFKNNHNTEIIFLILDVMDNDAALGVDLLDAELDRAFEDFEGNTFQTRNPTLLRKVVKPRLPAALQKRLTYKWVSNWLVDRESTLLYKQPTHRFQRTIFFSPRANSVWGTDIADFIKHQGFTHFRYLLVVIDYFSKMLYALPMLRQTEEAVIENFKTIIDQAGTLCNSINSDLGGQYFGHKFQDLLKHLSIKHLPSVDQRIKAAPVERSISTLRRAIAIWCFDNNDKNFGPHLQNIIKGINNRPSRTLDGLSAKEALLKKNHKRVYYHRYTKAWKSLESRYSSFKYQLGELVSPVNVRLLMNVFRKVGQDHYYDKRQICEIYRRHPTRPGMYTIRNIESGEILPGRYYAKELRRVMSANSGGKIWSLDRIVKTRIQDGEKQYFVKFKGLPNTMSEWITDKSLRFYKINKN